MRTAIVVLGAFVGVACATRRGDPGAPAPKDAPVANAYWRAETRNVERCGREIRYPADAVRNDVDGDVIVRIQVDERGVPVAASVIESPDPRLTAAVIEDLGRCRFEIWRGSDGKPIVRVIPRYKFHFTR